MAKTVNLTVKVDDTEFRQFTARFNAFSAQIGNLNKQFSQINSTIQKTTASSSALTASMKALWQTTKSLSSTVSSITTHFMKWATLIGGVGTMLAMGGGLFGIERLAASILQKRRLVLGLGGDYGKTQAAQIFGRGVLENPQELLKNIAMGKGGSPEQLRSMTALGIPFGTKMTPEEIMPKYLDALQRRLKGAAPGTELRVGQAFGAESMGLSPTDIMRLKNMTRQELKDLEKQIAERGKEMTLSKQAQKGWADLELQFQAAKTSIESIFGEKLASLSKPLSDLSGSIVKLVKALLDMPIVEKMIKQLTTWLNQLSEYLKSNKLDEDLKKFTDKVESWVPVLKEFKDAIIGFVEITRKTGDIMGKIWNMLKSIWKWSPMGLAVGAMTGTGVFAPSAPVAPPISPITPAAPGTITLPGVSVSPGGTTIGPQGSIGGTNQFASTAFGGTRAQSTSNLGFGTTSFMGGSSLGIGGRGGLGLNQFGGGSSFALGSSRSGINLGGAGGSMFAMGGAGGANINRVNGGNTMLALGGGGGGSNRLASWSQATEKAVPGPNERSTWAGLFGFGGGGGAPGGGSKGGGALDAANWQANRTASIVIRNTPGANVNMSASGMSG